MAVDLGRPQCDGAHGLGAGNAVGQRPRRPEGRFRALVVACGAQGSVTGAVGCLSSPDPLAKLVDWEVSPALVSTHSVWDGCPQTGPHPGHRTCRTPSISNLAPGVDDGRQGRSEETSVWKCPQAAASPRGAAGKPATPTVVVTPKASISGSRPHCVSPPRGLCSLIKLDLRIY